MVPNVKMPHAWAGPVAAPRPLALVWESDGNLREALAQALIRSGYDVTLAASAEEAQRLMQERSFNKVYGSLDVCAREPAPSAQEALSGPRVEDQGDGTARVQFDQVLSWSTAVELLDILADAAPSRPRHRS